MNKLLELKNKLAFINDLILDKSDVVYFDYPLHLNIGDLLIYHGTEKFFRDNEIKIKLRRSVRSFNLREAKKIITSSTTILCHGGGNFGDLYRICQRLRETLVRSFPNNRIIVLPQTAFFSNQEQLELSAKIFQKHTDCHLLARDMNSYNLMKNFSPNVYLSPDMAHQLYGSLEKFDINKCMNEKMYFLRKDSEKIIKEGCHFQKTIKNSKDWQDIIYSHEKLIAKLLWPVSELAKRFGLYFVNDVINTYWYRFSNKLINRSQYEFLSYKYIETDRLHGHIFSCLLEIPHKVLDNSYGKNYSYNKLWTNDVDFVTKDD